jgi:hypothetical protein
VASLSFSIGFRLIFICSVKSFLWSHDCRIEFRTKARHESLSDILRIFPAMKRMQNKMTPSKKSLRAVGRWAVMRRKAWGRRYHR